MYARYHATAGSFSVRGQAGWTAWFWYAGSMTYTAAVLVANFKIFIMSYSHSFLSIFCIVGSIAYYFGNVAVLDGVPKSELYDSLTQYNHHCELVANPPFCSDQYSLLTFTLD